MDVPLLTLVLGVTGVLALGSVSVCTGVLALVTVRGVGICCCCGIKSGCNGTG